MSVVSAREYGARVVTLIRDDRTENIRHRAAIQALQEAVS